MSPFSDWPSGAVATFGAATLAATVALVSVVATLLDGVASRRQGASAAARDQWWARWSFTIEKAMSEHPTDREIGLLLLALLVDIPVSPAEDVHTAIALARAVAAQDEAVGRGP